MVEINLPQEDRGLQTLLSEHPEVRILFERRAKLQGPVEINGINPILHVTLEAMVENQLHSPDLPEVREAVERLEGKGLTRHAARAAVAEILTTGLFEVLKENKDFDQAQYIRQLTMLGRDSKKTGRNDPCPCGSGKKYKRCCGSGDQDTPAGPNEGGPGPRKEISPLAGRLVLGTGGYMTSPNVLDTPLNPLFQLENRVHIANYLEKQGDLQGAAQALAENIGLADRYDQQKWLNNALYDMLDFCLNRQELFEEGLAVIEKLLPRLSEDEKGFLLCDRADITARMGRVEEADSMFAEIFAAMPAWHFGRYRYALHLEETGRKDQAIAVLRDLVARKAEIDRETYQAAEPVLQRYLRENKKEGKK